jgi:protein-arginine kinase activator protein McsA
MKTCKGCKQTKELSEFTGIKNNDWQVFKKCVDCREKNNIAVKKVYHKDPTKSRSRYSQWVAKNPKGAKGVYLRKYWPELTSLECADLYYKMLDAQNGLCAICQQPETSKHLNVGKVKELSVDHNHSTGQVRGLLCYHCNLGIGHFKDSETTFNNIISYLRGSDYAFKP